jgi:Cdc6-like AAA superfamily ATPase
MALTRSRIGETANAIFDDIVKGKGRGLNILLQYGFKVAIPSIYTDMNSGPPGVGKTLTAEAISEHFHRPLYSVCGIP